MSDQFNWGLVQKGTNRIFGMVFDTKAQAATFKKDRVAAGPNLADYQIKRVSIRVMTKEKKPS